MPEPRCERHMRLTGEPCTWPAAFRVGSRKHDSELSCTRHLAQTVELFIVADGHPVTVDKVRGGSSA